VPQQVWSNERERQYSEPECPVEAIFPEDALPEKWEPFVKINYAYGDGADVVNKLTDEYATEHNVQNPPLE
jgi:hypothetical protein